MTSVTLIAMEGEDIVEANKTLLRLAAKRKSVINVVGPLAKSKIAWKLANANNSMLHRFVASADAMGLCHQGNNVLGMFYCGRSLLETFAAHWDFARELQKLAETDRLNWQELDDLLMRTLFSTRDAALVTDRTKARSILTSIDRIDRDLIPKFRSAYDTYSERCHPNSMGHRALFSKIDYDTGTVSYDPTPRSADHWPALQCAIGVAMIYERCHDKTEALVVTIAERHHADFPIEDRWER